MWHTLSVAAIAALFLTTAARAESAVAVIDPYALVTGATATSGAIYLTLENHGDAPDRLIAVSTDAADVASLHTSAEDASGLMQMVAIDGGIVVPAQGSYVLQRGRDHIMLMGLTRSLVAGDTFSLTLTFEGAGAVVVKVVVDNKRTPEAQAMEGHSMP